MTKTRADFMSSTQRSAIREGTPRRHDLMVQLTGVARPGKTAKDRYNKGVK